MRYDRKGKNRVARRKAAHTKSYMETWAEREVRLACEHEKQGCENGDWGYGCACYNSALKAMKSLMGDGHSGYSIGLTKNILNRLIDGKPLTPIEDVPEVWSDITHYDPDKDYKSYQCKRMYSLFKYVYGDGHIEYRSVDQCVCIDIYNGSSYTSSLVSRIIREMYPITMPYMPPDKRIMVYCEDFLTDEKNGDFDTVGVYHAILSNGEKVYINRWFKEGEKDWVEIDDAEYQERKADKIVRG